MAVPRHRRVKRMNIVTMFVLYGLTISLMSFKFYCLLLTVSHFARNSEFVSHDPKRRISAESIIHNQTSFPRGGKFGPCLNDDFSPSHKIAIVTLNSGDVTYLNSSIALALSIRHGKELIPLDLVILEIESHPLASFEDLSRAGWKRCTVERIPPPRVPHQKFLDQFTKLHVWNMTFYDSVIYMDSDTYVIGSIDGLMSLEIPSEYPLAATRDFRGYSWKDTFNLGVFKIHPNQHEFYRLLDKRQKNDVDYEATMCEQSWLSELYPKWLDFGMENNFNIYAGVKIKRTLRRPLQIIHFTMPKPWECNKRVGYKHVQYLCEIWKHKVNEFWSHRSND